MATQIVDGGDVIVVQAKGNNLTRAGQRYDNVYVIHFKDARIIRYEEYADTELMAPVLPDRIASKAPPKST